VNANLSGPQNHVDPVSEMDIFDSASCTSNRPNRTSEKNFVRELNSLADMAPKLEAGRLDIEVLPRSAVERRR
jgi:hypothetical protein